MMNRKKKPLNTNFIFLMLGRMVSDTGAGIQAMIIPLYIIDTGGSAATVGLTTLQKLRVVILSDLRNISDNSVILNEITVIENFVKHNCDLMKNGTDLTESIPEIKTSSTIHDSIVDKSEEYKKMRLTKKELQNILDEQYLKGEINLYEYRCFINNVFGKGKH